MVAACFVGRFMKFYDLTQAPPDHAAAHIHRWYADCADRASQGAQGCWAHWQWDVAWVHTPLPAVSEPGAGFMLAVGIAAILRAVAPAAAELEAGVRARSRNGLRGGRSAGACADSGTLEDSDPMMSEPSQSSPGPSLPRRIWRLARVEAFLEVRHTHTHTHGACITRHVPPSVSGHASHACILVSLLRVS
jgi:hypothetical protein